MIVSDPHLIQRYYKALLERDSAFVGIFYVAVKTTQVFCIATCRARKPKFVNVIFYTKYKGALQAGYRPCKVCRPTENSTQAPESVQKAMQLVRDNPEIKFADAQLKGQGISPEFLRRWFKQHYGMTFQTFQRMYRINNALLELKAGKSALDTAYDSGYESLSGFGYSYKKLIGRSPKGQTTQQVVLINRVTTPLGPMFICSTERGICLLEFVDKKKLDAELSALEHLLQSKIIAGENSFIKQAKKQLSEYFDGQRQAFTVALDMPGTDFQISVWQSLLEVPYAQLTNYQQQSQHLAKPTAVRAVAGANARNRIAIIVPCHRVVAKSGHLTGYGGGLARKKWLIEHEKTHASPDKNVV